MWVPSAQPAKLVSLLRTDPIDSAVVHGPSLADIRQGWSSGLHAPGVPTTDWLSQGSLFGPYTPLQQLDVLADEGTKSYVVGSTNSLLLQQKDRYSDILINVGAVPWSAQKTPLTTRAPARRPNDEHHIDVIAGGAQLIRS